MTRDFPDKWEYSIEYIHRDSITRVLNALGSDGWEVIDSEIVVAGGNYGDNQVFMKRKYIELED
tara:strand:+ start:12472 stop:12663 length:192 start_codon:yes stop_codon:yes gene_type:complete